MLCCSVKPKGSICWLYTEVYCRIYYPHAPTEAASHKAKTVAHSGAQLAVLQSSTASHSVWDVLVQHTRDDKEVLVTVREAGTTLYQHWLNVWYLLLYVHMIPDNGMWDVRQAAGMHQKVPFQSVITGNCHLF